MRAESIVKLVVVMLRSGVYVRVLYLALICVLALVGVVQADLWNPAVDNPSFEDNVLNPAQWIYEFDGWYDGSAWIEYATGAGGDGIPFTPYGHQWLGLPGNGASTGSGYVYQQVGTWQADMTCKVSFLFGKRAGRTPFPVRVSLWVGGNTAGVADDVPLGNIGATLVDSVTITPDFGGENVATKPVELLLNSGRGFVDGDALWLEIRSEGNINSQLFIDNVAVMVPDVAVSPEPDDGAAGVNPNQMQLSWSEPNIPGVSYVLYFGTDPNMISNTRIQGVHPPYNIGNLNYATKYYWQVDTIESNGNVHSSSRWHFTTGGKTYNPDPADGAKFEPGPYTDLSWSGDSWATSYKVYGGTEFPLTYLGQRNQNSFNNWKTSLSQTRYYWRVDEYVNGQLTVSGDVWSFTTRKGIIKCPEGDIDSDYTVGITDLALMVQQWLFGPDELASVQHSADLTGDGRVDMGDFAVLADNWLSRVSSSVVINEIHYNPDVKNELVEFVELYNTGPFDKDISGWYFSKGITYTFPQGTILSAGKYIVVTQDASTSSTPITVAQKYNVPQELVYGPYSGKLSNDGETIELCDARGHKVDEVDYKLGFPWPIVGGAVPANGPAGTGCSIQLINPMADNNLGGSWRSAYPTPAADNIDVYRDNVPPQIRQVKHEPQQPKSSQVVTITAKVTDTDGIANVILSYQIVDPGNYIPITLPTTSSTTPYTPNPAYNDPANWHNVAMHDDGLDGDVVAGDDVYTVRLPGSMQMHRRLIRYRITATDSTGVSVRVPYDDDGQPNFAYFVYDGVPAWRGAINPNGTYPQNVPVTFSSKVMSSVPVYHLISRATDVTNCQYNSSYDNNPPAYHFAGTLVYDGKVYDDIHYRIRGQASTFRWGKNKWKFKFNRGHYFQARDNYGKKYKELWKRMYVGTGTCPWWQYPHPGPWDQGAGGMMLNEALGFKLYELAGVPSCHTNYFELRVIDNVNEADSSNQYNGDFWGLYLAIEPPDGRFLKERNMPDGNLYRMDAGANKKNQGPSQSVDNSDVNWFTSASTGYNRTDPIQPLSWWQQHVNLPVYYSYNAVGIAINNSDRRPEANCTYYHNPDTNRWWMLPWDLDLTYEWGSHWDKYTDWERFKYVLNYAQPLLDYKNRSRELQDLLLNSDQGAQVVDSLASVISDPNDPVHSLVAAERARWDYCPRVRSQYRGLWYEHNELLTTKDWAGMVAYMKRFITPDSFGSAYGGGKLTQVAADPNIPYTPHISFTGGAGGFAVNNLKFQTSPFADPQGNGTFGAMQWRIAEVTVPATIVVKHHDSSPDESTVNLIPGQSEWKYTKGTSEPSDPVDAWRQVSFDDSNWLSGQTSIGYGDNDDNTVLSDMRNNYTTIYLRKYFSIVDKNNVTAMKLHLYVDDGCIIWINGTEVFRSNNVTAGFKAYNDVTGGGYVNDAVWQEVDLSAPYNYLLSGDNVIAIEVLNSSITSSDLSIDISLDITTQSPRDYLEYLPGRYTKSPKFEINPTWQSDEITTYDNSIVIPASVVKVGRHYRVRCRMKDNTGRWSHWSDPNEFVTSPALPVPILDNLRVTELMYNPAPAPEGSGYDNDDFEYIELKNTGSTVLDLSGVKFTDGIYFDFGTAGNAGSGNSGGGHFVLDPGSYTLVVSNKIAFESRYGSGYNIAGEYTGHLKNSSEKIRLEDSTEGIIQEFTYKDSWYDITDGQGFSLTIIDPTNPETDSWNFKTAWRPSVLAGGSPGSDDSGQVPNPGSVVINELLAHSDTSPNDWIELYNTTDEEINIGGWFLSDSADNLQKYEIAAGTVISAHGYIVFTQDDNFGNTSDTGCHVPFALSENGETAYLHSGQNGNVTGYSEQESFGASQRGIAFGRYQNSTGAYNFVAMSANTPGSTNAYPKVGPVVISEIMYNPPAGGSYDHDEYEYVELHNITDTAVTLQSYDEYMHIYVPWKFTDGIDYTFPLGTVIPAHGYLLVAKDPTAFAERYTDVPAGVSVLGPYSGKLSNGGEKLQLSLPGDKHTDDDGRYYIRQDRVVYDDKAPWPVDADGAGKSLTRKVMSQYGNDPANWQSAAPGPGE